MPRAHPLINNFTGGEWSARMDGRTDLEAYYRSCRTFLNFITASQGGGDSRPGSYFLVNTKTAGDKARLIPFSIKGVGEYVLELDDQKMRFIKCSTHEQIVDGTAVEIDTPWPKADLFELKYGQTPTELYFTHPDYAPRKLMRTSDTVWPLSIPTFSGWDESTEKSITGAVYDRWDESTEKNISGATQANPVVITATTHGFLNGDKVYIEDVVGMTEINGNEYKVAGKTADTFQLKGIDGTGYSAYTSDGTVKKARDNPVIITATAHGFNNGDPIYISDILGMNELKGGVYKVADRTANTFALDGIDGRYYETYVSGGKVKTTGNIFGSANNYPSAIGFYQQRMILSGTKNHPDYHWCSKVGDVLDYKMPEGLIFKVYHDRGLAIKWLAGKNKIAFGADSCEGVLGGEPLSDTNYQLNVESGFGSEDIQGRLINELIMYVQDGGKRVRGFVYNEENQGWLSPDMTFYAEHITGTGIVETEVQRNPDTILWCVRSDGVLVGFTYQLQYGVAGWHRHTIGATSAGGDKVESIAVVRGADEDEIWISVKRTINSTTKRFIEYFKPRDFGESQEDCFFVDCGISLDKGDAVSITGITQAHPVVVTAPGHTFIATDKVRIWDTVGSTELNGEVFEVQDPAGDTFELKETDDFATWSATQTYYEDAIVERTSKNYIALQESLNKDPATETDYWSLWPTAYTSGGYVREVVNTVSGLTHLNGETVQVCVNGGAHPGRTVSGGSITLNGYYSVIHVGLGYNSDLKPMRIEAGAAYGTAQGKMKRINKVGLRVYKSLGCKVGSSEEDLTPVQFRDKDDKTGSPPALFTGDVKETWLPSGWGRDGDVFIRQDQPLPLNVVAIMPELVTNA